jgi:hypothetical protein
METSVIRHPLDSKKETKQELDRLASGYQLQVAPTFQAGNFNRPGEEVVENE